MAEVSKIYDQQLDTNLYTVKNIVGLDDEYFVFIYADVGNSSYATAVVGRYSGGVITYGIPVVFSSSNTETLFSTKIAANKIAIIYENSSNYPTTIVGSISGDAITFGTPVVLRAANLSANHASICYISDDKYLTTYQEQRMKVCTVSGTAITAGTELQDSIVLTTLNQASSCYDGSRVFVAWTNTGQYVRCRSYNISGSTITEGSNQTVILSSSSITASTFTIEALQNNQIMIFDRQSTTIRANLYDWVADGSNLSYVTNTSVGISSVYNFNYMFDTVRVSDTQINFAYTTSTAPYTYYVMNIETDGSSITLGTAVDMALGTDVGLSQISLLGSNTIASQGREYHIVATSGLIAESYDLIGETVTSGSMDISVVYNMDGLVGDTVIGGSIDWSAVYAYSLDGDIVQDGNFDTSVLYNIDLIGDTVQDGSFILVPIYYIGKQINNFSGITTNLNNKSAITTNLSNNSKITIEIDNTSSIL
jgi:hypothetical protein